MRDDIAGSDLLFMMCHGSVYKEIIALIGTRVKRLRMDPKSETSESGLGMKDIQPRSLEEREEVHMGLGDKI